MSKARFTPGARRERASGSMPFAALSLNQLSGQLYALSSDWPSAAMAGPLNYYASGTLPTTGCRLIGLEIWLHFGTVPSQHDWTIWVNGVHVPAFNAIMLINTQHASAWPVGGVVIPPAPHNFVNLMFSAPAAAGGNFRPAALLHYTMEQP